MSEHPKGGIQAYDYEPPKERYPIDFLRAGYFLFLHVVAFTCALAWLTHVTAEGNSAVAGVGEIL